MLSQANLCLKNRIRDSICHDQYRINIPSIVFRANAADFKGLAPSIVATNEILIRKVAQVLEKFPSYNIKIVGHGNNISKIIGASAAKILADIASDRRGASALGRADRLHPVVDGGVAIDRGAMRGARSMPDATAAPRSCSETRGRSMRRPRLRRNAACR